MPKDTTPKTAQKSHDDTKRTATSKAEPQRKLLVKEPEPELIKAAGPAPADPMPEQSEMTIEQLLADPRFDPEGRVRPQLAEISAQGPLGQRPPSDLVNADGTPASQEVAQND